MDIFTFNARLTRLTSLAECATLFHDLIAPFGFDVFACGRINVTDSELHSFFILNWPERWRVFYQKSALVGRDPVVSALRTRREPFTWGDLRRDRTLKNAGRAALDLAAAEGWTEGMVVPIARGQQFSGLVSLAGSSSELTQEQRDLLCLASLCLYHHASELIHREGFMIPPMGLTPQEIACLRLVVQGLSDGQIAERLSIAVSTAHEYVEKAKRRLKVRSRPAMAATAVALGIAEGL